MRSESLVADRLRASSLSGSENPVTTVLAVDRIRCLSFTSIEQEALVELTNFSNCSQQNRVGARRNPENRRVSFGGDNLLHSEENANKKVEKSENEPENVNQGLPHACNEINRPRQDSGRYLSPINEKGCNNKSFEE